MSSGLLIPLKRTGFVINYEALFHITYLPLESNGPIDFSFGGKSGSVHNPLEIFSSLSI